MNILFKYQNGLRVSHFVKWVIIHYCNVLLDNQTVLKSGSEAPSSRPVCLLLCPHPSCARPCLLALQDLPGSASPLPAQPWGEPLLRGVTLSSC